jgi:beta-fructofuranosidase
MVLKLPGKWLWDSWYAHDGRRWHVYFLEADAALGDPDLRHTHVSQGHAVSDDLVTWAPLGTCFAPAAGPAFDDFTTWTGSVVRDDAGLWHLFYTGTARAEAGLVQRIGHATAADMHSWQRVGGDGLCLDLTGPHAYLYETAHDPARWHDRAMRDPWVMRDPEGKGWLMVFTARVPGTGEPNADGAIGLATSPDLGVWTLQPPVYQGSFGQLEVPQIFQADGRWYCLFCTTARDWSSAYAKTAPQPPVTGSHYLTARHPRGPWTIAPGAFLDGALPCRRYAARIVATPDGLRLLGFADGGRDRFGGYIMDPARVTIDAGGRLRVDG